MEINAQQKFQTSECYSCVYCRALGPTGSSVHLPKVVRLLCTPGIYANIPISFHFLDCFLDRHQSSACQNNSWSVIPDGANLPIRKYRQKPAACQLCQGSRYLDVWMCRIYLPVTCRGEIGNHSFETCNCYVFQLAVVGFADKLEAKRRRHNRWRLARDLPGNGKDSRCKEQLMMRSDSEQQWLSRLSGQRPQISETSTGDRKEVSELNWDIQMQHTQFK